MPTSADTLPWRNELRLRVRFGDEKGGDEKGDEKRLYQRRLQCLRRAERRAGEVDSGLQDAKLAVILAHLPAGGRSVPRPTVWFRAMDPHHSP